MATDRRLEDFAAQIHAEVADQASAAGNADPETLERAFAEVMAGYLTDRGVMPDMEVCPLQCQPTAGSIKVSGYSVDEEESRVDLLTVVYRGATDAPKLTRTEVQQAQARAARFFTEAVKGKLDQLDLSVPQHAMVKRLYAAGAEVKDVRVFVATDGIVQDPEEEGPERNGYSFRFDVWDIQRLFRCVASGLPYESVEIDFVKKFGQPLVCIPMPECGADYEALLTVMPGRMLHDLYDEYGSRLLELNVRSFLQAHGKVNRGIRDTIRDEPARFLAYNNGISATAESAEFDKAADGTKTLRLLRGLQIVNGGQTVASIHRAGKTDKADLAQIFVQAKITIVAPERIEDLVPKISRYANTQNRVSDADFSSNDPFHVELQRLSEVTWPPGQKSRWFYERARGQYQVARSAGAATPAQRREFDHTIPSSQKITKTDVAKYLNTWWEAPHTVSFGAQKNFVTFMTQLRSRYGKNWKPDQTFYQSLIAKAIIYKRCESLAKVIGFPAYRANVVTYTVAYLAYRTVGRVNFQRIWEEQRISQELDETLKAWMPRIYDEIVQSAGTRNVTEWCKKDGCWQMVRNLPLEVPAGLQEELIDGQPIPTVGSDSAEELTYEDRANIARVMNVPAATWLEIHGWGVRTGHLKSWQYGIAYTLSGYASSGWQRVPSARQARFALEILDIARTEMDIPEGSPT